MPAQSKRAALTEAETDQIRELADRPPERVKLYIKFIDDRIASIRDNLAQTRPVPQNQPAQLHDLMDQFTRLIDELQDNLDGYADQHDDIRKALKNVIEADAHWQEALKTAPPNPAYEFVRKTALDAAAGTAESSQRMIEEQNQYFKDHKKPVKN